MRQRLGIAQALLHRPSIVFHDEPDSTIDPDGPRDHQEPKEGQGGVSTVVVSTHVLADVERICNRVAILDRGRLVTEGSLAELLAAHARPIFELVPAPGQDAAVAALIQRLRGAEWAKGLDLAAGTIRVTVTDAAAAAREILPLVVSSGVVLSSFEQARPTLEDVFLELVGPASAGEIDGRGFLRPRETGDR
jgi:ABC-2 type transport system ATP-binding protein